MMSSSDPISAIPCETGACRLWVKERREQLKQQFYHGTPTSQLIHQFTVDVDHLLVRLWNHHIPTSAADQLSLIAVGGYGRGELHPYSDIDLLVLITDQPDEEHQHLLKTFLTQLWDVGLDIGHSVRSIDESIHQAQGDITVATSLMESRPLAGSLAMFEAMRAVTGPDRIWPSPQFFSAKWHEQQQRHAKFNNTAYNLEPNVKEGPGGLRDIQNIGWVAKRHFGADTLAELVTHQFLTAEEHQELIQGEHFLWKIRFALHLLANRREDRLLFEHQKSLADELGYRDDSSGMAVEQLMKEYYRTITELERLNEMLLQLYQQEILHSHYPRSIEPINRRFQANNGYLEAVSPSIFTRYPFALLELFLILSQHQDIKGISAGTIRLIRGHLHLIDDSFREDLRCRSLFMELLRQPSGLTYSLHRMNRYGVLAAYLPEFGHVVGQMQYDLFHTYTVDEHTLRLVRNLRRLTIPAHRHELPLCSDIMSQLPKQEILYISALYHDIGKGRGGDHSILGGLDATAFCLRHDMGEYDTHVVRWLVENHLLMSLTAQRKDLSDPDEINTFANLVGQQSLLDYLFLLTVADIRATSPTVWNSWKAALLTELYQKTTQALRRGLTNPLKQHELIALTRHEAHQRLLQLGYADEAITPIWQTLGEDYNSRYNADEIVWHLTSLLEQGADGTVVASRQVKNGGATEIFIHTPLRTALFRDITLTLDQLGLNIVDARIMASTDNFSIDTYTVLHQATESIPHPHPSTPIEESLRRVLISGVAPLTATHRMVPRRLRHFTAAPEVVFHTDAHHGRTVLEVIATDRPGLLSQIAVAIHHCQIQLHNARITTLGERVEDLFFITVDEQQPLLDLHQQAQLQQQIMRALIDLYEGEIDEGAWMERGRAKELSSPL